MFDEERAAERVGAVAADLLVNHAIESRHGNTEEARTLLAAYPEFPDDVLLPLVVHFEARHELDIEIALLPPSETE
jgi:hypothetical protein